MGFFNEQEIDALTIQRMVLHVIGHDQPITLQPEIEGMEHLEFFLARIHDVSASAVHKFAELSPTKLYLQEMATGRVGFAEGAQELARRFSAAHRGSSSDGAFFIIELGAGEHHTRFYCLIKYDYRAAVELAQNEGRSVLRQIVQAFVREKRAIQKCCVVRLRDGVAEAEVSAVDRMGKAPDLTDYFEVYLDVKRHRDEDELSDRLSEALRRTFVDCSKILPGIVPGEAVAAAKAALQQRENVDEEAVLEAVRIAVGNPEDEEVRSQVERKTARALRTADLDGIVFRPNDLFFRKRPRKKVRTAEGVSIDYPGELEGNAVQQERLPAGGWKFTITTDRDLAKNETVSDRAR